MSANGQYIKKHFLDQGALGLQIGQGYYTYPEPEFERAGFLDLPDVSKAEELARLSFPAK